MHYQNVTKHESVCPFCGTRQELYQDDDGQLVFTHHIRFAIGLGTRRCAGSDQKPTNPVTTQNKTGVAR